MNLKNDSLLLIEIDLVFHGFYNKVYGNDVLLKSSDIWEKYLSNWIQFIRQNDNNYCPDLVRESNQISLGLQLIDDEGIIKINQEWRNKSEKTDVLSFPIIDMNTISHPFNQCVELGDIFVSVPTAYNQAKEQNHSLSEELCWLVSHGLLHLLGWDHQSSLQLKEMLNFQEQLLQHKNSGQFSDLGGSELR